MPEPEQPPTPPAHTPIQALCLEWLKTSDAGLAVVNGSTIVLRPGQHAEHPYMLTALLMAFTAGYNACKAQVKQAADSGEAFTPHA